MMNLKKVIYQFFSGVRQLLGDDAYDRYLDHHVKHHPQIIPLTRKAFFKAELERKWNGIRRCC
ncbi:MAG: hypothetical protein RL637_1657 [Pseudomonadota bacterium]|jgi:uncharacterized short protein YbdD (DUF466 family)